MPRPKGSKNKDKTWAPKRELPPRDISSASNWKNRVNKVIDVIHEKKDRGPPNAYLIKKPQLTFINYQPIQPHHSFLAGKTISRALLQAIYEGLIELHTNEHHILHQSRQHI
jgi:hypothetical protein